MIRTRLSGGASAGVSRFMGVGRNRITASSLAIV